jgi:molecular chaperone GrpE
MNPQRPRTRAEERIAELDASPQALSAELDQLRQQLIDAEQEAADNKAGWQRTVVDDFDRAIANMPDELKGNSWVEGVAAIDRKLDLLLTSEGLSPIEAVGKQFDPHEHEAIAQEERPDVADGTVIAEVQRGYRIRDRVLRPAMVVVAQNGNNSSTSNENQPTNPNFATDSGGIN